MMQKKTKLLLLAPLLILLLVSMTISDNYYSNLAEQYPILQESERVEGKVTGITIHHKYVYLELDAQTRRLIPPSFLKSADPTHLHKIISIGDHFLHEANSKEVSLGEDQEHLSFIVAGFGNI